MEMRSLLGGALVAAYVLGGALVHLALERDDEGGSWTFVDCLYFVSMTMSTVGYGDLSPTSEGTRWWTILMIILGVSLIFPLLASLTASVTAPLTKAGRDALEKLFPQQGVDIEGDGSVDYKIPRPPVIFYSKNLSPSLFLNLAVQLISAGIFCALEDWTFSAAFYHCLVTCTTVGYGDVTIVTQAGRGWAAIHMVVAVILVAELLSTIGELSSQRAETLKRIEQLQRRADTHLFDKLMKDVEKMRAEGGKDSPGITELEFTLSMLLELEMVPWDYVELFIKQFRKFDATGLFDATPYTLHPIPCTLQPTPCTLHLTSCRVRPAGDVRRNAAGMQPVFKNRGVTLSLMRQAMGGWMPPICKPISNSRGMTLTSVSRTSGQRAPIYANISARNIARYRRSLCRGPRGPQLSTQTYRTG